MVRLLLLRGLLAGLCAGIVAAAFAYVVGEPQIDRAIAFENHLALGTGHAQSEIVGRDLQSTVGLLVASTLYGVAVGGLFALVFAGLYGRVVRASPARTALWLAAAAFVTVSLIPFLKYPANPPGVGSEETIGTRTALYFAIIAISILAAVAAQRSGRWLAGRRGSTTALLGGLGLFAAAVVAAALMLPGVHEVPQGFPAETLWRFRLSSLGMQLVLWATVGAVFAHAAQRLMVVSDRLPRALSSDERLAVSRDRSA
jgi:MFS family permease